jgi:hypothetical protein
MHAAEACITKLERVNTQHPEMGEVRLAPRPPTDGRTVDLEKGEGKAQTCVNT